MTRQNINIGTAANDKSGDPLRTAFAKVNSNFTELYALSGSAENVQELVQDYAAPLLTHVGHSGISFVYDNILNKIVATVSVIPTQLGNSGRYLTTDGVNLAWGTVATDTISNAGATLKLQASLGRVVVSTGIHYELFNGSKFSEDNASTTALSSMTGGKLILRTTNSLNTVRNWEFSDAGNLKLPATGNIFTSDGTAYNDWANITGKPTIPTSFSSLVNGTKTVSLGSTGTLSLPAQALPLTQVNQITTATINRTGASTDTEAIAAARDLWFGAELTFTDIRDQDEQIFTEGTRPWAGMPSWEAYPLIQSYTPPDASLPPTSSLIPAAATATTAYLGYQELVSNIDIVSGNKVFSFENTGNLRVPGVITKDNSLILQSSGVSGVLPTGNSASINPDGQYGRVLLRTYNGETLRTWQFDINGALTLPNGAVLKDATNDSVAFGQDAGTTSQGQYSVAVGAGAGYDTQSAGSIALGFNAGRITQGAYSIAIGTSAGATNQATDSIAIGRLAGQTNQHAETIILNATGSALNSSSAIGLYVAPIKNQSGTHGVLQYNGTTKEVTYSNVITVNSNTWTFGTNGELTFPDNTTQTGKSITVPVNQVFDFNLSRTSPPGFTSKVSISPTGLTTDSPLFQFITSGTSKYWTLSSQAKRIEYSESTGQIVFGTATKNGTGASNDIELFAYGADNGVGSVYISAGSTPTDNRWKFDASGRLTTPQTSSVFVLGTDFTQTIIGDGDGTGYIRVESNTGSPNFTPSPISTRFYNFLSTLTAGTRFTVNTVVDGTTYNTVVAFTQFAGGNPVDPNRNDLYYTFVSGDDLPFSYNATALTLTFTSTSVVVAPTSVTFADATVQTTAYTGFAATAVTASTASSVGYLGMPQNAKSSSANTVIGDQGKHIYITGPTTITIDGSLAYPIGATIAFINSTSTATIAISGGATMRLGGVGTTGSRSLAPYGMATAVKVDATTWYISGVGLT